MAEEDKTTGGRRSRRNPDSDVHATGKVVRGGNNDNVHATGKVTRGRKQEKGDKELRPYEAGDNELQKNLGNKDVESQRTEWPEYFELEGKKYKKESILSDASGEAIVFTVSRDKKKYALKIYYYDPYHRPNHKVLEKIRRLGGSGLLVPIISHGEWNNPDKPGEKNDYELMEFCEGGSLDGVVLEGDEKALSEVAVKMGAAIDFLSKHGILHRDIKPANFFYADKARTQIVLADFGISVECPVDGYVKIDEMRSPVYAAPEFYTNVPGEPAEVGVESDYFSLGVALLCLWMGKSRLTANESALLRSKLNESLPMPKDMSTHTASLIKALTRLKMSDRANFEDIKRWVKGEDLHVGNPESPSIGFHVVFNSAKNQVADSPAELAHYLVEDMNLGKKYLYSGRVTRWLEETGRNEVAVNIEEIVEKIYPKDQDAGLWAVAYMLDPAMEYETPDGTRISDPGELGVYATANGAKMAEEVILPDSRMKIYLRACGLNETVKTVEAYADSLPSDMPDTVQSTLCAYYLAMLLNPAPALILYSKKENGLKVVGSVEEVLATLYGKEEEMDYFNWYMLKSPAFVLWLAQLDPALAGKIRMLQDNVSEDEDSAYYNSNSPYRIAYELNPEADFYFSTDLSADDRCYTVEKIGEILEEKMANMASGEASVKNGFGDFLSFENSRYADYLRSRGKNYMTFLKWMKFCTAESKDNLDKPGPYNIVIGVYKGITGFLGRQPYYPLAGEKIYSPEVLFELSANVVADSIEQGQQTTLSMTNDNPDEGEKQRWLQAWLTVFFQEDPKLDLSKKFTYENETVKYLNFLSRLAPDNFYVERYFDAIGDIDDAANTLKKSNKSVNFGRWFFWITCGIPSVVMILAILFSGLPETINPIKGHIIPTFIICTIGAFIYNTALWGPGFWTSIVPGAVAGAVLTAVFYACFAFFPEFLGIAVIVILVWLLIWKTIGFLRLHKADTGGVNIRGDEFEYRQLDALYYAYKDINLAKDNVITQYADMQTENNRTNRSDIWFCGWRWGAVVWTLSVLWYFWTPALSQERSWVTEIQNIQAKSGQWAIGSWEAKYGRTRIVCNIDSVNTRNEIFGTMIIAGQTPVAARGKVANDNDTLPESFSFKPEETEYGKQTIDATYNKMEKKMEGYYYDRKGVMHQIAFTSTPLDKQKPDSEPTSSSQSTTKKRSGKKKEPTRTDDAARSRSEAIEEASSENSNQTSGNILGEDTMY